MSRYLIGKLAIICGAGALLVGPAEPAAADERCYEDWSDAAPVVAAQRLHSARDVHALARDRLDGDVVRIMLCEAQDGFVYRVVLRRRDGRIGNLTVGADSLAIR